MITTIDGRDDADSTFTGIKLITPTMIENSAMMSLLRFTFTPHPDRPMVGRILYFMSRGREMPEFETAVQVGTGCVHRKSTQLVLSVGIRLATDR